MPTCLQILNSSIGRRADVLDLISLGPAHSHTPSMAPFVNGPRVDLPCYLANIPVTFMLHRIHPIIYPTGCEILWLEHTYDWGGFFRWLIYWDETDFEWFAIDLRLFKLVISNSWAVRWFFLVVISRRIRPKNGYIFNFGYILSFIAMCISLVSLESLWPHLFFFLPWSIKKLVFNSGCDWRTS